MFTLYLIVKFAFVTIELGLLGLLFLYFFVIYNIVERRVYFLGELRCGGQAFAFRCH